MRSYGAAVRRVEREQQKQARESEKIFKLQQKLEEIENAQQAVLDWENYINKLQSVHKNSGEPIDWAQIGVTEKPTEPKVETKNEVIAKNELVNFKPSIFDKLFGQTQNKINRLNDLLEQAKVKDKNENDVNYKEYLDESKDWEELQEISKGIKDREVQY